MPIGISKFSSQALHFSIGSIWNHVFRYMDTTKELNFFSSIYSAFGIRKKFIAFVFVELERQNRMVES